MPDMHLSMPLTFIYGARVRCGRLSVYSRVGKGKEGKRRREKEEIGEGERDGKRREMKDDTGCDGRDFL
jgi:hypothetical protein